VVATARRELAELWGLQSSEELHCSFLSFIVPASAFLSYLERRWQLSREALFWPLRAKKARRLKRRVGTLNRQFSCRGDERAHHKVTR